MAKIIRCKFDLQIVMIISVRFQLVVIKCVRFTGAFLFFFNSFMRKKHTASKGGQDLQDFPASSRRREGGEQAVSTDPLLLLNYRVGSSLTWSSVCDVRCYDESKVKSGH